MRNETHLRLEQIAAEAGWDSFTLLLLISRWIDAAGHSQALLDHLASLAVEEDLGDDL